MILDVRLLFCSGKQYRLFGFARFTTWFSQNRAKPNSLYFWLQQFSTRRQNTSRVIDTDNKSIRKSPKVLLSYNKDKFQWELHMDN